MSSSSANLKQTLMDVRKMRRAVRMRKQTDPEVVSKTLETILHEAIALSTTSDGVMSQAAIKELRQVRRSLVAGQINAGQKTAAHIGAYSAVLDQIDNVSKEVQEDAKEERTSYRSGIMENLPSSETVVSAIMTANPLLGYSIKIGRDLLVSSKKNNEAKKKQNEVEAQKRKEQLQQQEQLLLDQMKTDELQEENAKEENKQLTQKRRGIYKEVLEQIRDELRRLEVGSNGGQSEGNITIEREQNDSSEVFETVSEQSEKIDETNNKLDQLEETNNKLEQINETNKDELQFIRDESAYNGLASSESEFEGGMPTTGMVSGKAAGKSGGGILSKVLGGLMGLAGGIMAPFASMFGFLKVAGGMLLKFGKFGGIFMAFKGIYDFIDGIFRADEILGDSDLDWKDRLKVGISNVLSGLLEPINWLAKNLFDMDLMNGKDRDGMTKQYFEFFDNFTQNIIGMAQWIWDSISEWVKTKFDGLIEELTPDWLSEETDEEKAAQIEKNAKRSNRRFNDVDKDVLFEEVTNPVGAVDRISDNIKATEDKVMEQLTGGSGGANANTVVAPTTNQTNINQHQYNGSSSSESKEPTHRRFSDKNSALAW